MPSSARAPDAKIASAVKMQSKRFIYNNLIKISMAVSRDTGVCPAPCPAGNHANIALPFRRKRGRVKFIGTVPAPVP